MPSDAVLNIRLPKDLKKHGNQVLERHGKSVSQIVRDLYTYMESEQDIPDFAKDDQPRDKYAERRDILKGIEPSIKIPDDVDPKDVRHARIIEKYGESA